MRVRFVAAFALRCALLFLVAGLGAACGTTAAAPQVGGLDEAHTECEAVPVVAILLDKSRSAPVSLVSQLTRGDLNTLIDVLRACGGELAVGAIRGRTATPLVRLLVETPPQPAAREDVPQVGNPMILAEQHARVEGIYQKQRAAYEHKSRRWSAATEAAIEEFRQDVEAIIDEPTTAPHTDMWAALKQADLFLRESREFRAYGRTAGGNSSRTRHVLVALTDGIHTAPGSAYHMQSTPDLFVVNSAGEVGALAGMSPRRFESFGAALRALDGAGMPGVAGQEVRGER
jgi:hypothetical protein